jgi:hypothetical protein
MRKRRAFTRVGDPSHEVKRVRGSAKPAAPDSSKPPPAMKPAVPRPSKSSSGARAVASGSSKPPSAEPMKEQGPPSPLRTTVEAAGGADLTMDICVDDYRVGGVMMFDAHIGWGLVAECLFIIIFSCGDWVLDKIVVQGRMLGNWLLSWLRWRPRRLWQRPRRTVLRRTHGPSFAPAARLHRPPPLKTWWVLFPSS